MTDAALDTTSVDAFDMASFLALPSAAQPDAALLARCREMSAFIAATGVLVVRDPRVSSADNDKFLRMMQRYYTQPVEVRRWRLSFLRPP